MAWKDTDYSLRNARQYSSFLSDERPCRAEHRPGVQMNKVAQKTYANPTRQRAIVCQAHLPAAHGRRRYWLLQRNRRALPVGHADVDLGIAGPQCRGLAASGLSDRQTLAFSLSG